MNEDRMLDLLRTRKRGPSKRRLPPPISWAVILSDRLNLLAGISRRFRRAHSYWCPGIVCAAFSGERATPIRVRGGRASRVQK